MRADTTIDRITLHFKKPDGEIVTVEANEGDDIVDVSWEYDLDIEGACWSSCTARWDQRGEADDRTRWEIAACEKSVACSTCHVILEEDVYDKLEEPDDDENVRVDHQKRDDLRWTILTGRNVQNKQKQDMLDLAFGLTDT